MSTLSIPTNARLPSSLRISSSDDAARKILARLSRASLLSLVLDWLDDSNYVVTQPYLMSVDQLEDHGDSGDFYPPASSLRRLRQVYLDLQTRKGSKREVLDRILEGDWRHGLTLYQLAMADLQHLYDHPTSHKWAAHRILPLDSSTSSSDEHSLNINKKSLSVPRIHPSTFLERLQTHVLPDVKAHFQFDRSRTLRMVLLRIFIIDSPYNTNLALLRAESKTIQSTIDPSRTVYVAFPDNAPFVYITNLLTVGQQNAAETKNIRSLIFEGIRKSLSKPRERYTLVSTGMTTRNLLALMQFRGPGHSNAAGGGWGIYAKESTSITPLDQVAQSDSLSETSGNVKAAAHNSPPGKRGREATAYDVLSGKRAKLLARARFGDSADVMDGHGLERVDVVMEDLFSTIPHFQPIGVDIGAEESGRSEEEAAARPPSSWTPSVKLTLQGSHVFAGIRQLVEGGVIDGERMPGWLTGEENVTSGTVRQGRIRAKRMFEI